MDEVTIDKDISFIALLDEDGKVYGYSAFLGGDNDSGVTVNGDTKADCLKALIPYLEDAFDELDNEID